RGLLDVVARDGDGDGHLDRHRAARLHAEARGVLRVRRAELRRHLRIELHLHAEAARVVADLLALPGAVVVDGAGGAVGRDARAVVVLVALRARPVRLGAGLARAAERDEAGLASARLLRVVERSVLRARVDETLVLLHVAGLVELLQPHPTLAARATRGR